VTRWGGAYVLIAKGNQPTLYEDLALFFDEPPVPCTSWHCATTLNKGHGRLERRTITTSTELREWFARDWCGIEQVFRIEWEVSKRGNTSRKASLWHHELVLAAGRAWRDWATGPAALVVRLPTPLAARCDRCREDASQVRTGQAPVILAVLNAAVLALMDLRQVSNVAAERRRLAACPTEALRWVLEHL